MTTTSAARAGELPEVSVVIPAYRAGSVLARTVRAALGQTLDLPFEVIVVESSGGDVAEGLRARFPSLVVVAARERLSPGAARNAGARVARGGVLVFLDADCVAPPGWLATLVEGQRAHGAVVGGSVALLSPHTPLALLEHAMCFSHFLPERPAGAVAFVPSCNLALAALDFWRIGGFSERFERAEDMAFCVRARQQGRVVLFLPEPVVEHARWPTLSSACRKQWASGLWSARLRRTFPMRGSTFAFHPMLALLLAPYRFLAVGGRLLGLRRRRALAAAWFLLFPLSLSLVVSFTLGFAAGAREPR